MKFAAPILIILALANCAPAQLPGAGVGMVYAYPSDQDGLLATKTTMQASAGWTNTRVKAFFVRTLWNVVEPSAGVYYWDYIDAAQVKADTLHRKWILQIVAGTNSPSWIYSAPYNATAWSYQADSSNPPNFNTQPLMWETAFQNVWLGFVDTVCARYGADPYLIAINLQGFGRSAESFFVALEDAGGTNHGTTGVGDLADADARAVAYGITGYSGSPYGGHAALKGWEDAAKTITARYATDLPGKFFTEISGNPVNDAANHGPDTIADFSLWASTNYPTRYGYENDGLSLGSAPGDFGYNEILRLSGTTLCGWQFNLNPSTAADFQNQIIIGASAAGARYIEASPGNCDNAGAGWPDAMDLGNRMMLGSGVRVLGNISTRLNVETGDDVLIGGFIITGTQPKDVIVRAIGPSLTVNGVPLAGRLLNPTLALNGPNGLIASNDNWQDDPVQAAQIIATGIPPTDNLESAIVATLPASPTGIGYTAVMSGVNNTTGIGLVEAYDLDRTVDSTLANISTRGLVQTGDNVMIGGLIALGTGSQKVLVRAIGPSLANAVPPVADALADPVLELYDSNGMLLAMNDNWQDDPVQAAEIIATGIPPTDNLESAIVATLPASSTGIGYTAIVQGANGTTGVALVEFYALAP